MPGMPEDGELTIIKYNEHNSVRVQGICPMMAIWERDFYGVLSIVLYPYNQSFYSSTPTFLGKFSLV